MTERGLYAWRPAFGTRERRLVHRGGWASSVRTSPDGEQIAYGVSGDGGGLWFGAFGGPHVRLGDAQGAFDFTAHTGHFYFSTQNSIWRLAANAPPTAAALVCSNWQFDGLSPNGTMMLRSRATYSPLPVRFFDVVPTFAAAAAPIYSLALRCVDYCEAHFGSEPFLFTVVGNNDREVYTNYNYLTGDAQGLPSFIPRYSCYASSVKESGGRVVTVVECERRQAPYHERSVSVSRNGLWARLPAGATWPFTWMDDYRLLYSDGAGLKLLDTTREPWTVSDVAPLVDDYLYAAATNTLFYVISGHGGLDGLARA